MSSKASVVGGEKMFGGEQQETSTVTRAGSRRSSPDRHRFLTPRTVVRVAEARLPTDFGEFRIAGYRSLNSDEEFVALSRGELRAERPTLVRIHSQCMTGDVFGSVRCDCGRQLRAALELIGREGF